MIWQKNFDLRTWRFFGSWIHGTAAPKWGGRYGRFADMKQNSEGNMRLRYGYYAKHRTALQLGALLVFGINEPR